MSYDTAELNLYMIYRPAREISGVVLGVEPPSLVEFAAVARYGARVELSADYIERVVRSRDLAEKLHAENRVIYGLTTGFGDNVRSVIPREESEKLQANIIRSHAVSVGEPLSAEGVRALWLMQLLSLGRGYSGVRFETLELIAACLNAGIVPYAPAEGSVQNLPVEGYASLVLMGEGKAWYGGRLMSGAEALASAGLKPIRPASKEGLCLTNGINGATGLIALALYDSLISALTSDISASMTFELLRGTILGCDERLHSLKAHPEQAGTAANVRKILADSGIMEKNKYFRVQDPYVIRCVPQLHGAAKRFIKDVYVAVANEMDSCNDNPVLWPCGDDGEGLMGSNFDGTYVGAGADVLCMASANLAKISERRADKILNRYLNDGFYPSLLAVNPGVDNGYMIAQYTAAGLLNEIRGLCIPATGDSVPVSANWEDPVSMAWWAAMKVGEVAAKLQYILAIELMTMSLAFDMTPEAEAEFATATVAVRDKVREVVPPVTGDRHFGPDIEAIKTLVTRGDILQTVHALVGDLEF